MFQLSSRTALTLAALTSLSAACGGSQPPPESPAEQAEEQAPVMKTNPPAGEENAPAPNTQPPGLPQASPPPQGINK